jgi:hypothetical protein
VIERELLPRVTRLGRRVLIRSDVLMQWLDQKRTPSRSLRNSHPTGKIGRLVVSISLTRHGALPTRLGYRLALQAPFDNDVERTNPILTARIGFTNDCHTIHPSRTFSRHHRRNID